MKRIITSAFVILLTIGAANAQTTSTDKHAGHKKERGMAADKLNLSADQKAQLKTLHEEQRKQMEELRNNSQLTAEQKQARRKELHDQFRTKSEAILTPAQRAEASKMREDWKAADKSLNGKFKGARAGKDPLNRSKNMQQELNLTADQQKKVADLRSEFRPKLEALRNDQSLSNEQKRAKMRELMNQQQQQMKSILTPEQAQKMESFKPQRPNKGRK
jgi:Spy/CpxP family protein refolding chaperone